MTTLQIVIMCAWIFAVVCALSKSITNGALVFAWAFALIVSIIGMVA